MNSPRKNPEEELAFPELHQKVRRIFDSLPRGSICDAAAGNGILSEKLRQMGFRVISTDRETKPNLRTGLCFFLSDLNRGLALPAAAFDYCVSLETIEHLENPWHFTRELARVLKPGGRLILSTPNLDYLTCKISFAARGSFYPFFGEWQYRVIGHLTPLSRYYLERVLGKAGFRVERIDYNRYRIPLLRIPSPLKAAIFGESLIITAVKL